MLKWTIAGFETDEINNLAASFEPPFRVSRQQIDYYRKTRGVDIGLIQRAGAEDAMTEGLSIIAERVRRLKQLATLMERDLFGGFLWLDQVKGVGSGDKAEIIDYEEFNRSEVDAYRAVLDDIAKELGHRVQKQDLRIDDWQSDIVELLKAGKLSPADVRAAYPDLAEQFFAKAGVDAANDS
jgi:hypothetical protein